MKRLLAAFAVLCVLSFSSAEAAGKTKVLTVDPVMELLVRFIGGPYVETASGWSWGEDGSLTAARSVLMAGSGAELPLIALNPAEYEEFMISAHRKGRRSALTEAEKKLLKRGE